MRREKLNVLFMQSQTYFGADSLVHGLLMRYFDRRRVEVHVACNSGTSDAPSPSFKALAEIPNLHLRPTHFGTSVNSRSRQQIIKSALNDTPPALADLAHLAAYIRQHRIDIIHCTEKPRDAFYGLLLARATGAKCVIHLHVKAENWISPLVRWSMRHADALVGVSEFVKGSIIDLGFPAERTHYVLNSLDTGSWDPTLDGSEIRKEFGIPREAPVLSIISRLFSWKGHTELLKALALVKDRVPAFKLLLVGVDDPRAMPGRKRYSVELRTLTQELGLEEQIIFTGFRKDVPAIMAASDIFAMPSFEEPFGMVYLEAMAMKKPIIALDNGGAREVVEHGKSGLLSLPQDIEGLAANIITLINDPALRQQMGEYGYARAKGFFHPQRMADQMEELYRGMVGPKAAVSTAGSNNRVELSSAGASDPAVNFQSHKPTVALLVGSSLNEARRAAAESGEKPRVDVLEMENRFGTRLYDFVWLKERLADEPLFRMSFGLLQKTLGWSCLLSLRALWATRSADVVYASGEDVGLSLAAGLRLLQRRRPLLVMRVEQLAYGSNPLKRSLYLAYLRFAIRRVDVVLCRTQAYAQSVTRDLAVDPAVVRFVPEPTDPDFFTPEQPVVDEARVVVPDGRYLVSAGLEMRDYLTLIEAVRGLPVQLVIGAGSPWSKFRFDASTVPELPANVHVASFTPQQMRELYRTAAAVVIPVKPTPRACGMNVVLEAWAMKRAVIATRTRGLTSYITDGENGLLVPPEDAQALRGRILYLLEHPEQAERMGASGQQQVVNTFNVDHYVETVAGAMIQASTQTPAPAIAKLQVS